MTVPFPEDHPRELLVAYLDDELKAADRERVEAWLARSSEGREELERLRETWDALSWTGSPEDEVSEGDFASFQRDFWDRVESEDEAPSVQRIRRPFRYVGVAAAAGILLLAGAFLRFGWLEDSGNSGPSSSSSAPSEDVAQVNVGVSQTNQEGEPVEGSSGRDGLDSGGISDSVGAEAGDPVAEDEEILSNLALLEHLDFLMADGSELDEHVGLDLEAASYDGEEFDG